MGAAHEWDDPYWAERESSWASGCRWLQSWWRETELGLAPGPWKPVVEGKVPRRDRLVASMLPEGVDWSANYLTDVASERAQRLAETHAGGIVDADRLRRNLLSSQPACLNLFAPLRRHPEVVARWLRGVIPSLPSDLAVTSVEFEWAPPREEHFGGGSAFDAYVLWEAGAQSGFVGIETKYVEDLRSSAPKKVRQPYIDYTESKPSWRPGAVGRVSQPLTRQFWLNLLLGQSLFDREPFDRGEVIVLSAKEDDSAFEAACLVAAELDDDGQGQVPHLHWSSYDEVLDAAAGVDDLATWRRDFRRRYLDFGPVAHLLDPHDVRRGALDRRAAGAEALLGALGQAEATADRVLGPGSIVEQRAHGDPAEHSLVELHVAVMRLGEATAALRGARIRASGNSG